MHAAPAVRPHPLLAVVNRQGHLGVVAATALSAGQHVLAIDGPIVAAPTRFTVQVGEHEHVDAEPASDGTHPVWLFLNHSCAPNTRLDGRSLVALVDVKAGDEVTFDYDTTEWDMASPFPCTCGAPACRGLVRGYRHLTPEQREKLSGVAPHLLAQLPSSRHASA